jgi:very-short-patch-repair endonuclease
MNYIKQCPTCNNPVSYTTKKSLKLSIKNNSDCKKCSALKREPKSEKTKNKISQSLMGRKVPQDIIEKIKNTLKIKFNTPEYKQLFSNINRGENNGMYGKHHDEEMRKKISQITKEKMNSPEIKEKMLKIRNSKEYKENFSKSLKNKKDTRKFIKCKNPNCNNTFKLHESMVGRKLYCSRKCRSEHHWSITPLFEKKCLNPDCQNIIKRKFKTKLDRIYYCSPICRKNHKEQIFQESLKDTIKSHCRVCNKELIVNREPCGKLIPRKICDECNKKENQKKALLGTQKVQFLLKTDPQFQEKMKLIKKEVGIKMKEYYKLHGLSPKWIEWYRNYSSNGKSKLEDRFYEYLKTKTTDKIERYYPISNMFVDFYIPSKNIVIECQGNFWHMNPNKYSATDYNKSTKRTAQEQWEKDKRRRLFMESRGYKVVELWESEINKGDYKKLDIYI